MLHMECNTKDGNIVMLWNETLVYSLMYEMRRE